MSGVSNLVGHHGAADACMFGPADHARLEECAVEDQLTATVEQIEQARLALGPVEFVFLLDRHPWHPPTLGGQRVTSAGQLLLFHEKLLRAQLPIPSVIPLLDLIPALLFSLRCLSSLGCLLLRNVLMRIAATPPLDVVARTAMFAMHSGHMSHAFPFLPAALFVFSK